MIKDDIQNVFRVVFGNPDIQITPSMAAVDIPNWDSFNHMNLIIALESELSIRFSSGEIAIMTNVGDLFTILNTHGIEAQWD